MPAGTMLSTSETCSIVVVVVLTSFAYRGALEGGFVFDDHLAIERNSDVTGDGTWANLLRNDFWGKPLALVDSNKSFRPLVVASFKLNHMYAPSPFCYHCVNVALHCVVTVLVCVTMKMLSSERDCTASMLVAGMVFGVHPVHAEAVTGIVGRAEIICAVFAILGFATLLVRQPSLLRCLAYLVLCAMAVLSKETGITVVLVTLASDAFMYKRLVPPARKVVSCALVVVGYWFLRTRLLGQVDLAGSMLLRKTENPILFAPTVLSKVLSTMYIQVVYLRLLVWPTDLCCEYPFDCIPLVNDFADTRCYYIFGAACGVLLVLGALLHQRAGVDLVAISWLVFPYLPASGIFLTIGTMLAERLLYLPSVGLALLLGNALKGFRLSVLGGSLAVLSAVWIDVLHARNLEWHSDETLFASALRVCPNAAKHHQQYGLLLLNELDVEQASEHLMKAHTLDPTWCEPPLYLGKVAAHNKNYEEALQWWRQCVYCPYLGDQCFSFYYELQKTLIENGNATAEFELGTVLGEVGNWRSAVSAYRQAGLRRFNNEDWEGAVEAFEAAVHAWEQMNVPLAPTKGEDEEMNHPCNIWYWQGTAYTKLTMQYSALRIFRRMFASCQAMPKAAMAAADGLGALYQAAAQSDVVKGRLRMTDVQIYEAHADVLITVAANKNIIGLTKEARDTYRTTAGQMLLKLSEVSRKCANIAKAVGVLEQRVPRVNDEVLCTALLRQGTQCGVPEALRRCTVCGGKVGKQCKKRSK
eukprot:TRINITY_DN3297_c0_g1_i2.p1 TRINITY_DN3297_c0_g1~~TRINITY_DN3297_c0_g1_i2.p1  ORF type:complete len:755 (+),score=161.91 TRINITY_DN3297_c0_g1_i2:1516-3780(+)